MWFKVLVVLFVIFQLSTALDCDGSEVIEGGLFPSPEKNKAGFGEFPWTVAIYKKDSDRPICAGAIIDEFTVLTTAFCVMR